MATKIPKFSGKLSKAQQRDFNIYVKISKEIRSFQIIKSNCEYESSSIEEWYWLWDTHGLISQFKFLQDALKLIEAKAKLNLTIKLWIEDILGDHLILTVTEVWYYCYDLPNWVWNSFAAQLKKELTPFKYQQIQYAPDNKTFWPPWMLQFDPSI